MKKILMYQALFLLILTTAKVCTAPIRACTSVSYDHYWNQGQNGVLSFTFPSDTSSWEVIVEFDSPLYSFVFYNGEIEKISATKYKITNKNYNGVQQAGAVLSGQWQSQFSDRQTPPKMSSAVLVSPSCGESATGSTEGSSATTTTISSSVSASPCIKITHGHHWNQGQNGFVDISFPVAVTEWKIKVQFDRDLSDLQFYNGIVTRIDSKTFLIKNKNYNGVQKAGAIVSSEWQAAFANSATPAQMVAAELVDVDCQAAPTTTTTTSTTTTTTTKATTTTTKITTTTTKTATTTETTKTTSSPATSTTTSGQSTGSSCSFDFEEKNSWNTGLDGRINLKTNTDVNGWSVEIEFGEKISSLSFYTANLVSLENEVATISNKEWNEKLSAGSTIMLDWQAQFNFGQQKPTVLNVKLNGQTCLSQVSITSTTQSSSTSTTTSTTSVSSTFQSTTGSSTAKSTTQSTTSGSTQSTESTTYTSGSCKGVTDYDYDEVIQLSNMFYQAQRSGKLDAYGDFNHEKIPYRGDSCLADGSDNGVDLTGGYFDAGDYVKFNFPMAASTTLLAWGAIDFQKGYASAGQYKATLNTIKWATDYFLKCHVARNVLYAQVGDGGADHAQWTRVEDMTIPRPSYKIDAQNPGSDLAGETAAALAAASIAFSTADNDYSLELLDHAKQLFTFADTYRGKYSDSVPQAASFYKSWSGYNDELLWSAAWLYKATGDSYYLSKVDEFFQSKEVAELSWDEKTAGATILLAQLTGQDRFVTKAAAFCDKMADQQQKTPKGMVWIQQWGPLRHASNVAFACLEAAKIDDARINKDKYYQFAKNQIHYALGDTGRSFVVGFGTNPPQKPHHRSSSCPVDPIESCGWDDYNNDGPNPNTLWGALVGGPGSDDSYEDDRGDYIKNEVACDYNAGFQSAVAGLRTLAAEGTLPGLNGASCKF